MNQAIISLLQALGDGDRKVVLDAFKPADVPTPVAAAVTASAATPVAKAKKTKKAAAPADDSAPKKGNAWTAFTTKLQLEHKEEVDAARAAATLKRKEAKDAGLPVPKDTQGAHLAWCSAYRTAHEAEWLEFKAAWDLEHPKPAPISGSGADTSDDADTVVDDAAGSGAPAKKRGPKKLADMTPEEQAAAKAARAAKKAAVTPEEQAAKKAKRDAKKAAKPAEASRAPSPPKMKDE
jgi:hypothetical protein